MIDELREFRELGEMADSYRPGRGLPEPPDEAGITKCIQVMLARQCIYEGMHGLGPYYRVLATPEYQGFFRKYFAAMGLELHHDTRSGMVALKVPGGAPRFDHQSHRLRKDETAVLLALRIVHEEAFRNRQWSDLGTVETTTNELFDRLDAIGDIKIEEARLLDILNFLKRKGIVEVGDRDPLDRVRPITILPGIEIAVPSTYIEQIRNVAEAVPPRPGAPAEADKAEDAVASEGDTISGVPIAGEDA